MKVEFTSQPPAFEIAPAVNGKAIIRFYENIETVEKEEIVAYVADCYETNLVVNSKNLKQRIEKNPSVWFEKAKEETELRNVVNLTTDQRVKMLEEQLVAANEQNAMLTECLLEMSEIVYA